MLCVKKVKNVREGCCTIHTTEAPCVSPTETRAIKRERETKVRERERENEREKERRERERES